MKTSRTLAFATLAALFAPAVAAAQEGTVAGILGIFNIFVGVMLTVALLLYGSGFAMWAIRLGSWPTYRTEAIRILEWAVAILFTLDVLLAVVQFFQKDQVAATYVLSIIIILLIIGVVIYLVAHSGDEKKEKRPER